MAKKKHKNKLLDDEEDDDKAPEAYLEHRLFVPRGYVTSAMKEQFVDVIENYYDETDENGELRESRDLVVKSYKVGEEYVSFERGDLEKIDRIFGKLFKIVDNRARPKLQHPIKFIGIKKTPKEGEGRWPLRPEQDKALRKLVDDFMYGILECPPRFGKTITATALICEKGLKTLILVNQEDLARQFEARFRSATNIGKVERKIGRQLIGYATKWSEFKKYDIVIATWQKFHVNRKKLLKFRDSFGLVLVDEVHRFASECSPSIVDNFNSKYRIGMTATPERKDRRDVIIKNIVGPVTVRGKTKQVPLFVRTVNTKFCPQFDRWNTYMSKIVKSKTRNNLALKLIEADVKAGRHVLVVTTRVKHMEDLKKALIDRGIKADIFRGGMKNKKQRQQVIADATSGKIQVTIANRQLLTGIDVPLWDSAHILIPSANPPNYYQEFSRVRTPRPGKLFALIYDYLDSHSASNGCYRKRHSLYLNKDYAPIQFVDENLNPLAKQPSLQKILDDANSPIGTPIYGDGASKMFVNNDDPDREKKKKRAGPQRRWGSFKHSWGGASTWQNKSKHGSNQKQGTSKRRW